MELVPGKARMDDFKSILAGAPVTLERACKPNVERAAEIVAKAAAGDDAVYGINTGFGKLASVRIPPEDVATLQRNLILSHCAGVGDPLPEDVTRLIMALKLLSLGRGASGVRWIVIEQLEAMLEHRITPVVPGQGSVGASGDLAPLAHMTAAMLGEGEAFFAGQQMPASKALKLAGVKPLVLGAKEGLALINGTQVSTALALKGLFEAWRNAMTSLVTGALSVDAAMGSSAPFRPEIHELRGHKGQIDVGISLRSLLDGSEIRESHREDDERVQDPYCLRCQPQVLGACLDLLRQVGQSLEIEANAVTDNPLVLDDGSIVSGGNFHAESAAFAADQTAIAISEIGSIAQRRVALLVDPALSFGLPAFLSPKPGLNSGLMIAEVTSAALMSENKSLTNPRSVDSTPTSANQEDHVSMGCHAARRLIEMNQNLAGILAVEVIAAAQGVELRAPLKTSNALQGKINTLRSSVPSLEDDRYVADDIAAATQMINAGTLVPDDAPVL